MIKVTHVVKDNGLRAFLVDVGGLAVNRRALNQVLAERFAEEVQDHWRAKNNTPNRLGGTRTNFWAKAADAVTIGEVSEAGASIVVQGESGQNVPIHIFGGTIVPKIAKSLTIPIAREAHGLRVAEYEQKYNTELFQVKGRRVLFEKVGSAGSESVFGSMEGRRRGNTIPLAARQQIRPVYALAKSAKIDADPGALPDVAKLLEALQEEAEDFVALMEGGLL